MKYRPLGNTGIMVSEIGIGTNTIAGDGSHGYVDEADGVAAVQRAYELGVTFFDTAESYSDGRSEMVLGKVLGNNPEVVICTKVSAGSLTPDRIRPAAEASLRRLNREVIDVYLLHNPSTELIADPSIKEAMEALVRDGLIRSYGVSVLNNAQIEQGEAVLREGGYTSIEVGMNVAEQQAADSLLPHARQHGVGTIIRVPLGSGLLSGKYSPGHRFPEGDHRSGVGQFAERMARRLTPVETLRRISQEEGISVVHLVLGWVLAHPEVSAAIPGCKNAAQVEDNAAASGVALSPSVMERLAALRAL